MSVVFTPEMFALLDSKTKQKVLAVASGTVDEKPKKVLSPEHLAKLKAGREAAAAKKAAEKAAAAPAEVPAPEAAAAPVAAEKPKKVLSPEHLAKLKAGREAAKAKKEAEKAAAAPAEPVEAAEVAVAAPVAAEKAKKVLSPEHLAKLKAGREAAKAKKEAEKAAAAEVPAAAPVPAPAEVAAAPAEVAAEPAEVAVAAPAEKAKKVLSPEHLAKLKAGREAAKAKKEAAKAELVAVSIAAELVGHGEVPESVIEAAAAAVADAKPKKVLSPEHLAKLKAGREAAKAKKALKSE
jgi:hypothetical protein